MSGLIFLVNVAILIGVSADRTGREEVVFPSMVTLRSGEKRLSFRALNHDIELKLEAAGDLFGETFFVESIHDGRSENPKLNVDDIKRSLYKDKRTGASLHIEEKKRILINGIINHKLRIEPIESEEGRKDQVIPHRIYEVIDNENIHVNDGIFAPNYHPVINESLEELRSDEPIYVEILIVTDTAFSHSFTSDKSLVIYLSILFNAAQCRYDNIEIHRVILIFTGVKINKHAREEPYIQNHIVQGYVMIYDVINSFSIHMGKAGYSSDIIVLLSKRKMGILRNDQIDANIDGLAFLGTACDENSVPDRTYKVTVTYDPANCYEGANLLAHECAHLLSCPHDGDGSISYLPGHPGSSNCPWNDGYIMSYEDKTLNRYYFSSCCQENILFLANKVDCLRKINTGYDIKISNEKPGEHIENSLSLSASNYANDKVTYYDYRCKLINKQYKLHESHIFSFRYPDGKCEFACRTDADNDGSYTYWTLRCLDGEMCDKGKRCSSGVCL